jgi:hypothetical protein
MRRTPRFSGRSVTSQPIVVGPFLRAADQATVTKKFRKSLRMTHFLSTRG